MAEIIEERAENARQWLPLQTQARLVDMGLAALSSRALVWVVALGGGTVWTMTVIHPEPLRIGASVGYCLCLLVPVLWRDSKGV